jgi:hypothetical protein
VLDWKLVEEKEVALLLRCAHDAGARITPLFCA